MIYLTKKLTACLAGFLVLVIPASLCGQEHELIELPDNVKGKDISFVACPIVQDTSSVPCWFASDGDTRFYLGIQQEISASFHPPQLGHRVLVEGKVLEGYELCGAPVIHPIKVSVLPELDKQCDDFLPAMPGIEPPPHERGPGPSNDGLEPRARRVAPAKPQPPFDAREFVIPFTFDSAVMPGSVTQIVSQAIEYGRDINAQHIVIQGYRASSLLSNGQELIEVPYIANVRAENLHTIFIEAGFPEDKLDVRSQQTYLRGNGSQDFLLRKVIITVKP